MMLFGFDELFVSFLDVVFGLDTILLDIVYHLALSKNHCRKLFEKLKTLSNTLLEFLDIFEFVLNVRDSVTEIVAGLTVDFLLKHHLSFLRVVYIILDLLVSKITINYFYLPS